MVLINYTFRYLFFLFSIENAFSLIKVDITRGNLDFADDKRTYFFPVGDASSRANGQYQEDVFDIRNSALDVIGKANFQLSDEVNLTTTEGTIYNDIK